MNTNRKTGPLRPIETVTVFTNSQEWDAFQSDADHHFRQIASHMAFLARQAAEHPDTFRLIERESDYGHPHQIRVRNSWEYLNQLAEMFHTNPSAVAESLVRGVSREQAGQDQPANSNH